MPLQLASAKKGSSLRGFQDPSIANARVIIDLIDAIQPGVITYSIVQDGDSPEVLH